MRELVAIGSQYPKALSRALGEAGDDPASPAGHQLVCDRPLSGTCVLHRTFHVSWHPAQRLHLP